MAATTETPAETAATPSVEVEPILVLSPNSSDEESEKNPPPPTGLIARIRSTARRSRKRVADAAYNSWQYLKGLFVSAETEEACRQVWKILVRYCSDIAPLDLAFGVLLISGHYQRYPHRAPPNARRLRADSSADAALAETFTAMMRHASASYGWKLLCGFMTHALEARSIPVSTISPALAMDEAASNLESMLKHTRLDKGDVLEANWKSETFSPGHYVALDRELDALVVSIRGTWGLHDSVADLLADGVPFSFAGVDGHAHGGVLRCALRKADQIEKLLEQHVPEKRLFVTGHSLGGGVATLLSLVLAQRHPDWSIRCFAYAPAASLTREVAGSPAVVAIVSSFVFRDDLVPRLSYGSVELLKRTIQQLLMQSSTTGQRLFQWVSAGNLLGEALTHKIERKLGVRAEIDLETAVNAAELQRGNERTFMFPAGRIFYIAPVPSASLTTSSDAADDDLATTMTAPVAPTPVSSSDAAPSPTVMEPILSATVQPAAVTPLLVTVAETTSTDVCENEAKQKQQVSTDSDSAPPPPPVPPRLTTKFAAAAMRYVLEEVAVDDRSYFSQIVVSGNMFIDHLPHKYEIALNRAADDITGTVHNVDPIHLKPAAPVVGVLSPPSSEEEPVELQPLLHH